MPDTTSRVPVAPQPQPQPHYDHPQNPQYPPPPGVRPDLAFVPIARPPRDTTRRWHGFALAAAAGAAIAATVTALITSQVVRTDAVAGHSTAPAVTVTATPAAPAPPAPLPTAQADRQTCNAWLAAGDKIHAAQAAMPKLPEGMTILDPAVRGTPEWSAAVRKAAGLYGEAGDALSAGIAPGTTSVLSQSAHSASSALHALDTADSTFDPANGNTYHLVRESADTMDVLCDRLAPR
ncbi:hypothetical protein [Mycobacterium sp.]|uniref:hypothetical protein n=1 Tax=Mycobacterium sp. TaxID=1785 RepID=UPI0025FD4128|nr:hypothetical protein [Mycobacterium sp.]